MDAIILSSCVPNNLTSLFRPIGAYQVAWYLRKHDYNVQVLEFVFKLPEDQILKLISQFVTSETKILGLGAMIHFYDPKMQAIIKKFENVILRFKKIYPNIKTVVGGPCASLWSRAYKNKCLFDYGITGYAEDTFLALQNHLSRGKPMPPFEIRDGNRMISENAAVVQQNLFDIKQDVHVWSDNDCIQPNESLPLELSRGCIFKCRFCRFPYNGKNKNDFNRDIECVKHELVDNHTRFGTTNYYMLDDTFNANQDRMKEFYMMTETLPFKISYTTYLRPDLLAAYPDTQYYLLDSGLVGAFLGVETFNKEAAKLINKTWSPNAREYLPRLKNDIWKNRVSLQLGLICGLPPETYEECKDTNQFCIDTQMHSWTWAPLGVNRDVHDPYKSEFDMNAEKYGFTWEVDNGRTIWRTDYCTRKQAEEWEMMLVDLAKPYLKTTAWDLIELANFGYTFDHMRNTPFMQLPHREINSQRGKFLANYFRQLTVSV
jgi:hypothetical protein